MQYMQFCIESRDEVKHLWSLFFLMCKYLYAIGDEFYVFF